MLMLMPPTMLETNGTTPYRNPPSLLFFHGIEVSHGTSQSLGNDSIVLAQGICQGCFSVVDVGYDCYQARVAWWGE